LKYPTPHLEKLLGALENEKLPSRDRPRLEHALARYRAWIEALDKVPAHSMSSLDQMVLLLNEYRNFIDLELIFDSPEDFLHRQKGQLKLDNSVLEEFLPRLVTSVLLPGVNLQGFEVGPAGTFSSLGFNSSLAARQPASAVWVRTKNQDFAISRTLYLRASHNPDFSEKVDCQTNIAYVVAECKTNLDKTMFQEACATAHDVKSAVAGSRYFLLCEWLDMTPVSSGATDIDEVIILRKAKRLASNVRKAFSSQEGRRRLRDEFVAHRHKYPLRPEMFARFLEHIRRAASSETPKEDDVLQDGFF
jgi:hypothetical protein